LTEQKIDLDLKNKELISIITPDGFELDWQRAAKQLDKEQINIQKKLFEKFREDKNQLLFYLAFSPPLNSSLSDSIIFLSKIARAFVNKLAKNPDMELLRENITINADKKITGEIINFSFCE